MNETITIALATEAELPACARLYVEVSRTYFTWDEPGRRHREADFLRFAEDDEVWVTRQDGALAGFLNYYRPEHFLHLLYVAEARRGQGVGSALLRHIRAQAGVPHSLKTEEPNLAARKFYERRGYSVIGHGGEDGIPWILLRSP